GSARGGPPRARPARAQFGGADLVAGRRLGLGRKRSALGRTDRRWLRRRGRLAARRPAYTAAGRPSRSQRWPVRAIGRQPTANRDFPLGLAAHLVVDALALRAGALGDARPGALSAGQELLLRH